MKKLKISQYLLSKVLGQVMIEPSIIKYLKNGKIYAYGSDWNLEINQTKIFNRRQILRLIRKFNKRYVKVIFDGMTFYNERNDYIRNSKIKPFKHQNKYEVFDKEWLVKLSNKTGKVLKWKKI